ncbi:MAG: Co2+/Mg2+ efflux protein ApaG [Thiotrichaceae bacterium]|nr:Co2+/Mg2+ efflux protein ApaG [Thiotrichaceae bacterium]
MTNDKIVTEVVTHYIAEESSAKQGHFVFSYTITINNVSDETLQLISRHWVITDADNQIQEVRGRGVVGKQPVLAPKESYTYSSGTMIETAVGFMAGSYRMRNDDGDEFDAEVPTFRLAVPGVLH